VLVRTESVTGHVPKNLSVGRTLKEHVAADQQPIFQGVTAMKMTKAQKKVGKVMAEYKSGKLHSGSKSGPMVKNPKQAIAIALSEAKIKPKKAMK